jgi:hypothetical protein
MGGRSRRPFVSVRKRPLLALLVGVDRVVVKLAGDTRERRLTASSKASQGTSGCW